MSCSICFSKINNEHKLECGHVFHKQCIEKWINTNPSCPICRCHLKFSVDKFVKLINEINELTGYKVNFSSNSLTFLATNDNYNKLVMIKQKMIEYNLTRNKGFSDDFLASYIGNEVCKINTTFKNLIID